MVGHPSKLVAPDEREAIKWMRLASEAGNYDAMFNYAVSHRDGLLGVPVDKNAAITWFEAAAVGSGETDPSAFLNLAWLYEARGGPGDFERAFSWFAKAADGGDARGAQELGKAYSLGRGVEPDKHLALEYTRVAAEKGLCGAVVNLGHIYRAGLGIDVDPHEALQLYKTALRLAKRPEEAKMARDALMNLLGSGELEE